MQEKFVQNLNKFIKLQDLKKKMTKEYEIQMKSKIKCLT